MSRTLLAALVLLALAAPATAQPVDVTFRFLPDLTTPPISPVTRAFVPGSFNDWGPNNGGQIETGAPSRAKYQPALNEYRYTTTLQAGQMYAYKVHIHRNAAGTDYEWYTDPLGTETTGPNSDSVVRVEDPFVFQIAREQNGTGEVRAVSAGVFGTADVESVTFTVNEATYTDGVEDTGDGIYRLTLPAPVAPGAFVRVTATDAQGRTATAEVGTIPPEVTDAPVPDGLEDGITVDPDDPTRAWLVLRAPGKQFVYALGSFNGWTADDDALMFRDDTDPLGTRWWIELTGLAPGQEATFQYWVDGQTRVADPYATKVYYPGESAYPAGAVDFAVGAFTPGAAPFPWTDDDWQTPDPENLVVYELLLRDFLRADNFTALTDTLDYLVDLGVTAIELMPVSEYDGDESWGYNPAFHLALDKHYGTPDAFKAFVDAAHARGLAVILDVVYNHATGQSPLVRLYNQGDFGAPTAENPWANPQARHPFNVFNDLDHSSPLTRLWLDKANRFWMREYHVDGYRFDLSKGFVQSCGSGGPCTDANFSAYNPARIETLTRMADALWAEHPDAIVILEHFADAAEERELAEHGRDAGFPGMTLWANMTDAYAEAAMGYLGDRASFARAYPPQNGFPLSGQIAYMESHDEQWMLYKVRTFGNRVAGYDTRDLSTALDRKRLATVFFLTTPGPKMLWQFGEVGFGGGPGECLVPNNDCPPGTPGRVDNKPVRWDYWADVPPFANGTGLPLTPASEFERSQRQKLYGVTAAVLDLRTTYAVFGPDGDYAARVGGSLADRWIKRSLPTAPDGQPTQAVVVGNVGMTETTVAPTFPATGTWHEYFSDTTLDVADPGLALTLRPGEYRIYTDVDVPSPDGDLGAVADEGGPDDAVPPGIRSAYPNPTAGLLTLALVADRSREGWTDAPVEVFDTLGRLVLVAPAPVAAPSASVQVDTSRLPTGLYVARWGPYATSFSVVR
ncbi:alpha-amylase family glycosyl hydrolase [Rubrivirga sp.]|uniref:alpha-amylase family glycosyl hydrolase n=1 Tax=Rubrivirga sp. TaxID=1885344 RepID=UPI003B52D7FC